MRSRVLKLLKQKKPGYVSGEVMAGELSVSRTAVWKAINSLQAEGYRIEGSPRRGYRLLQVPDRLYPAELAEWLQGETIGVPAEKIHYFPSLESTNETLKKIAEEGAPEGTIVLAEEQTRGKGRLGRSWSSPRGKGIWLSVLLKPAVFPQEAPVFTLIAAVTITRALNGTYAHMNAGIKWPNDILIREKKVCGILTELKAETDRLHYLVIGIGLNANQASEDFPPELESTATSLYLESSEKADRLALTASVINELDHLYTTYRSQGTGPIIQEWKNSSMTLGRRVSVSQPAGSFFTGKAIDIREDGALVVQGADGTQKHFHAGEVTLKKQ